MRHDFTMFEINLLHKIQEKNPEMHTTNLKTSNGRKATLKTNNITLPGKYSPIQTQLTYKCIVNNNADNINDLTTLISLKNTHNWLKVLHNSRSLK